MAGAASAAGRSAGPSAPAGARPLLRAGPSSRGGQGRARRGGREPSIRAASGVRLLVKVEDAEQAGEQCLAALPGAQPAPQAAERRQEALAGQLQQAGEQGAQQRGGQRHDGHRGPRGAPAAAATPGAAAPGREQVGAGAQRWDRPPGPLPPGRSHRPGGPSSLGRRSRGARPVQPYVRRGHPE